jgi:hypothetical protein
VFWIGIAFQVPLVLLYWISVLLAYIARRK